MAAWKSGQNECGQKEWSALEIIARNCHSVKIGSLSVIAICECVFVCLWHRIMNNAYFAQHCVLSYLEYVLFMHTIYIPLHISFSFTISCSLSDSFPLSRSLTSLSRCVFRQIHDLIIFPTFHSRRRHRIVLCATDFEWDERKISDKTVEKAYIVAKINCNNGCLSVTTLE